MLYFRDIVIREEVDKEVDEKIFKEICLLRINKLRKNNFIIPDDLLEEILKDVLDQKNFPILYFLEKYDKNAKEALILYEEFSGVYKDFAKFKTSLISTKNENEEFEELRGVFLEGYRILREEPVVGVHAEVQILSYIVRNFFHDKNVSEKQKIYIGISKIV